MEPTNQNQLNIVSNKRELSKLSITFLLIQIILILGVLFVLPLFLYGIGGDSSNASIYSLGKSIEEIIFGVILFIPFLSGYLFIRSRKNLSLKRFPFVSFLSSFIVPVIILYLFHQ